MRADITESKRFTGSPRPASQTTEIKAVVQKADLAPGSWPVPHESLHDLTRGGNHRVETMSRLCGLYHPLVHPLRPEGMLFLLSFIVPGAIALVATVCALIR